MVAGLARPSRAPTRSTACSKVMFSSWPDLGLGRRREDRLGQLVGLAAGPAGSGWPCMVPVAWYSFHAEPDEVAPHDALDRQHLGLAAQHRPAGELGARAARGGRRIGGDQVVGRDVGELLEPERRSCAVSTRPLSGIGSAMHHVEGGDAVGGDHQQVAVAGVVDVADLARVERGSVDLTASIVPASTSQGVEDGAGVGQRPLEAERLVELLGERGRPGVLLQDARGRAGARPMPCMASPARSGRRRRGSGRRATSASSTGWLNTRP